MYWRWFAVPLIVIIVVLFYFSWEVDEKYTAYIIPAAVLLAALIVLGPRVDWYFAKRKPPELDPKIRHLLHKVSPYYIQLSADQKKRMRDRMVLFMLTLDFKPQGTEKLPEDVKAVVAFYAAQLTLSFEEFMLTPFENVVIYRGPFPSPQFLEHWHISEIHVEDGVLLFSADHLMKGFLQPLQYYPIGLHEMSRAFMHKFPDKGYPDPGGSVWEDIRQISGVDRERLTKYIGLPEIEPLPVCITYFFTLPARFKAVRPDLYESLSAIFQQNP